ncbi:MAG: hypothetical protein CL489_08265 [Acidobacteria bacterium]|nr:hypothetical protein [Acidobacteriota bacterium]|tara:strand:+ start:12414 stop:14240 length:1827 start_codon:yes stop_codon:yes gene_type:complete
MKALSLFTGVGGIDLALESEGIDVVQMCEVDPFCVSILNKRFPNIPVHDDIRTLDGSQFKGVDIVVGGFPCFTKDAMISTENGLKKIDSLNVGERVLTHTNVYKPIKSRMVTKNKPVHEINIQGLPKIFGTEEHPFYVREKIGKVFKEPIWLPVNELKKNVHYCGIPINQLSENPYKLTEEECYILGRYLADGHTIKRYRTNENRPKDRYWGVVLSIGDAKLTDFKSKISSNYTLHKHTKSVHRAIFSSKRLVKIAEQHCGIGSGNKFISDMILSLPKPLLESFYNGYVSGDGYSDGRTMTISTVSKNLAITFSLMVAKLYEIPCSYRYVKTDDTKVIEGRIVNQKDYHRVQFVLNPKRKLGYSDGNHLWVKFRDMNFYRYETVYNIEVDDDNSYVVNGVVVHNCQPFSTAGKQKGEEDERYLWNEMCRIIRQSRPNWVIGENVKGLLQTGIETVESDLRNEGYEVRTYVLSAKDVGAYHGRERVFIIGCKKERLSTDTAIDGLHRCEVGDRVTQADERTTERSNENKCFKRCSRVRSVLPFRDYKKGWRTEPNIRRISDGSTRKLDKSRIKALGNAVVPQQILPFIRAIVAVENYDGDVSDINPLGI